MATLPAAIKTAMDSNSESVLLPVQTDWIADRLDQGAGDATLVILNSGGTVLLSFPLASVAFGDSNALGVADASGLPINATASAAGTAATAEYRDGDGNTVIVITDIVAAGNSGELVITDADGGVAGVQLDVLPYSLTQARINSVVNFS